MPTYSNVGTAIQFQCALCGAKKNQRIKAFDSKARTPILISLCLECGLVQQQTLPNESDLRIYYSHAYRQDYKSTYTPKLKHVARAGAAALNRLSILSRFAANRVNTELLDIGAGGGEFVYLAEKKGYHAFGIEPNIGYSEYANKEYGINIRTIGLEDLLDASVDIVTMFHVYEHMSRPVATMKKIFDVLREDGIVFVEVPNILQRDASPHNIFFKAHLFYFSHYTLRAAASQFFDMEWLDDCGNLKAILRKKRAPLKSIDISGIECVRTTQQRLSEKGWLEYLFSGKGWRRPLERARRVYSEINITDSNPRALLDRIAGY